MIDLLKETTRGLSEAARRLPSARQGKPVTLSCMLRWIMKGVRLPDGQIVRLEAVRLGGRWITSDEALQRFVEAQTPDFAVEETPAPPRSPTARQRASSKAARRVEKLGI